MENLSYYILNKAFKFCFNSVIFYKVNVTNSNILYKGHLHSLSCLWLTVGINLKGGEIIGFSIYFFGHFNWYKLGGYPKNSNYAFLYGTILILDPLHVFPIHKAQQSFWNKLRKKSGHTLTSHITWG